MKIFKSFVYADRMQRIPCFAAYVIADAPLLVVPILEEELSVIPVELYCGDNLVEVDDLPSHRPSMQLPTESPRVVLLRVT